MSNERARTQSNQVCTAPERVDAVLDRGVIVTAIPSKDEFRKALLSGQRLRFYIGADPTSTALHLSHAKNYLLLEEFRQLGHEVIVLFGDFTARIGDPSDKSSTRARLSAEQVKANVAGWMTQIRPLMNFDATDNPPQIRYNSDWLSTLSMEALIELMAETTVQRMLERDMFQKRLAEQKPIHLHEFLYPLMQGYDSVAMDVDVELCGTDQTFNALVGRTLQERRNNRNKFVACVHLMENPVTGELMSKSRGTGVFLDAKPFDMFGQVMAQPDEMTRIILVNLTRIPLPRIEEMLSTMAPMEVKLLAAQEITALFHGEEAGRAARERFDTQIREKQAPATMPEVSIGSATAAALTIVKACVSNSSNSELRRLFQQGGIRFADQQITDEKREISLPTEGIVLKVGKRQYFKVKP